MVQECAYKTKNDDSLYKAATEQCALGEATKAMKVDFGLKNASNLNFGSLSLSLIYEIKWYSWRNNMTAPPLAAYFLTWKRTYNCRKRRTEQANANDTLVCLSSTALRMLFALGIRLGAY